MNFKYKSLAIIFLLFLSGCSSIIHEYQWNEYKLTADRLPPQKNFTQGSVVNIIKGESDKTRKYLGAVGLHEYYASLQMLTNGLADHLATELQNKKIKIDETATKSLKITVNRSSFERGMWSISATLNFTVDFGNGKTKSFSVLNKSPATVDRLYNGVVARSVIAIMSDAEVVAYLKN